MVPQLVLPDRRRRLPLPRLLLLRQGAQVLGPLARRLQGPERGVRPPHLRQPRPLALLQRHGALLHIHDGAHHRGQQRRNQLGQDQSVLKLLCISLLHYSVTSPDLPTWFKLFKSD